MRTKLCPECQADRGIDPQEGMPGRSYFCDPCNERWSFRLVRGTFDAVTSTWLFRRRLRRGLDTAATRLRAQGWSDELVARLLATVAARRPGTRAQLEAVVIDVLDELAGEAADRGERTTLGSPRDVEAILTQLTTIDRAHAPGSRR